MRVLDPTAQRKVESAVLAKRMNTLDHKAVGLIDNAKANADVFIARIQEQLSSKFRVDRYFNFRKETPARGLSQDAMADLGKCNVVINGIAD